jgi:hypothetical protein
MTKKKIYTATHFIGKPPSWMMRSGITLIGCNIIMLLCASYYIKYPDKVTAAGVMTSSVPPIEHFAKMNGVIDNIFVKDRQNVKEGDPLIYIKNEMVLKDLDKLHGFMDQYEKIDNLSGYGKFQLSDNLQLGELQTAYNNLATSYAALQTTLTQMGIKQQITTLNNEVNANKALLDVIETEQGLSDKELQLKTLDYNRNKTLAKEGVISTVDEEKAEINYLQQKKSNNQIRQALLNNKIRESQLQMEIQRLSEERATKINDLLFTIKNHINTFKQNEEVWREKYYITAKASGLCLLPSVITLGRYIGGDFAITTILPSDDSAHRYAKVIIPSFNTGKIMLDTRAIVKVDAYPYKEYGIIHTKVDHKALLPTPSKEGIPQYEIHLPLSESLITSYGKALPYHPEASIAVDIITKDRSLFHRIFETMADLIHNR